METKVKRKRIFLGEMPTSKNSPENRFKKAHLKAYLKGKQFFNHDFEEHIVKQKFIPVL